MDDDTDNINTGTSNGPLKVDVSGYGKIDETGPEGNFTRRTWNPLSTLSSYTYHLRLYMMTPEEYNDFALSGTANPSNYYVIAETGGAGNDANRLKELQYDYYIDDVVFKTYCNTKGNNGPIIDTINFEFKIYEPYGFSFTSRLQAAARTVLSSSPIASKENINPLRQFFMLGITFYGYDSEGNPVNDMSGSTISDPISVRYFAVTIIDFKFKIDGKLTTYSIKAAPINVVEGFGMKRGQIPRGPLTVSGSTVYEAIFQLEDQLNTDSRKNADKADKQIEPSTKYNIVFSAEAEKLTNSKLYWGDIRDDPHRKSEVPSATNVNTTKDSNKQNAESAKLNKTEKNIIIPGGITIVEAIEKILNKSEFIKNKLKTYKESNTQEKENKAPTDTFQYFTIKPIYTVNKFSDNINDYNASIEYKIFLYNTPFIRSEYVKNTPPYPEPHKTYNYFFTGQNSEVISYEQTFNNLYFVSTVNAFSDSSTDKSVTIATNKKSDENAGGEFNFAGEGIASVKTSLYSIADQARAKVQILGDPDYLMTLQLNESQAGKTFYEDDGFTISPRGGQVFIKINFNEPGDYSNETGYQLINDKIQFYNTPSKSDGVLYMVNAVTSSFSKGKFTQDLDLFLTPIKNNESAKKDEGREPPKKAETGATMSAVPTPVIFEGVNGHTEIFARPTNQELSPTGPVTDGESSPFPTDQSMMFNTNPDDDNSWGKVVTISDYGASRELGNPSLPNGFTI
jgi:hypothetical protein